MSLTRNTTIVFEGVGTRGDVAPVIAIAASMVARGYTCHLVANDVFGHEAKRHGIRFHGIAPPLYYFRGAERWKYENYLYPQLGQTIEAFRAIGGTPALVVNLDRYSASNLLAEAQCLRVCRLHLSPFKIRSLVAPAWPFGRSAMGQFGQTYLKYQLPRFLASCDTDPRIVTVMNRCRETLGLPAVSSGHLLERHVCKEIALFPSWYCAPATDWPPAMELVGFPFWRHDEAVPERLARFIEREGRPIVFTPGTAEYDPERFLRASEDCCERLGMPGLFLSPHVTGHQAEDARFLCVDFVPLDMVLEEAALLVHHGGIGTAARALRAGVPQIVVPSGFDRPDNGHRIELLNAGRVLEPENLSGHALSALASSVLADAGVENDLRRLKGWMTTGSEGVSRCAQLLQEILERSWGSGEQPMMSNAGG